MDALATFRHRYAKGNATEYEHVMLIEVSLYLVVTHLTRLHHLVIDLCLGLCSALCLGFFPSTLAIACCAVLFRER